MESGRLVSWNSIHEQDDDHQPDTHGLLAVLIEIFHWRTLNLLLKSLGVSAGISQRYSSTQDACLYSRLL